MATTRLVTEDIVWVGGSDRRLSRFENLMPLDQGITYNAFLILDEKTALLDTVDATVAQEFLDNVCHALGDRSLDYLVLHHMEPDHGALIGAICERYPEVKLVGNNKTFQLLEQFNDTDYRDRYVRVAEGDRLELGRHTLRFLFAPMVHWPEVMFSYEQPSGILFSADAFGSFGAFNGAIFSDEDDFREVYLDEARRYYTNIVGKYGTQVQSALKKTEGLDIKMICPMHGPILRGADMALLLEKYHLWSRFQPEEKGVLIAYASMYGNTEKVAHMFADALVEKGVRPVRMFDVSKTHSSYLVAQAFRFSHWVFASVTYNMRLYPMMETLLQDFAAHNLKNRDVALISNGSWAPAAGKVMTEILGKMQNVRLVGDVLNIRSSFKKEQIPELDALVDALIASGLETED